MHFLATCPAVTALCCGAEETTTILASGQNGFTPTWSKGEFANLAPARVPTGPEPELIVSFRDWFRQHRGAAESTLHQYARGAAALIDTLGADPSCWNAVQVRKFMLDRSRRCGAGTTQKLITSLRAFLRYLRFRGLCSSDLDQAVPAFAPWRLARLPRCLSSEEVDRLIAACDGRSRDACVIAPSS